MKTGVIKEFTGEHFFLSNFYESKFMWRGNEFPTAEHAFQWAKALHTVDEKIGDFAGYALKILKAPTPAKAKYYGRSVRIDLDTWEKNKVAYMREIVHAKFRTAEDNLVGPLINTGATMLIEGNDWGDKFWGRCYEDGRWVGLNTLGVILMEERGWWSRGSEDRP